MWQSKDRSKDARWTPCLPPETALQLSAWPPSGTSPSWIKYPWKDGRLFSIVLNNRHNQQIRHTHYTCSGTDISSCGVSGTASGAHKGKANHSRSAAPHTGARCPSSSPFRNRRGRPFPQPLPHIVLNMTISKNSVFQCNSYSDSSILKELFSLQCHKLTNVKQRTALLSKEK